LSEERVRERCYARRGASVWIGEISMRWGDDWRCTSPGDTALQAAFADPSAGSGQALSSDKERLGMDTLLLLSQNGERGRRKGGLK
jgi:hypothetical protein